MSGTSIVFAANGTPDMMWSMGGWLMDGDTVAQVTYFVLRDGKRSMRLATHVYQDSGRLL